ncbi:MAG TPA: hypothetical protein VMF33_06865 [Acidimicrobiales bacterium]|nr:hypothetical protein [Acidimicrobiales bacterium]
MSIVARSRLARRFSIASAVVVIAGASVLVASPIPARAVSRVPHASSVCGKVSAASVSAIVGYKVPAPTTYTIALKPTKENYEVSGSDVICTYGAETSMATILKAVSLSVEIISKPLTEAQMQASIAKATKDAKFTFSAYSGLGVPAFYFKLAEAGITGQGLTVIANGTHYYGASVETAKITKSQLGSLAKLAEQL